MTITQSMGEAPKSHPAHDVPGGEATRWDSTLIASALTLNLLGLALPLATLHVYDRVLPNQSMGTLWVLAIGLCGVATLELALRALQSVVLAPSAAWYARDLKIAALERLLHQPKDHSSSVRMPTETIERLAAIDRYAAYFGGSARQAFLELPFALIALAMIAVIGGSLALAPLVALLVYLGLLALLGRLSMEHARSRRQEDLKANDFLLETFSSILTLKSLGLEELMRRRYERLLKTASRCHERTVSLASNLQRASSGFGNIATVATVAYGASLAIAGEMTIGAVAACSLLAGRAVQPAVRASRAWHEVMRAGAAREEIARLFAGHHRGAEAAAIGQIDGAAAPLPDRREASAPPSLALAGEPTVVAPGGSLIVVTGGDAARRTDFLERAAGLSSADGVLLDGVAASLRRLQGAAPAPIAPRTQIQFKGSVLDNITLFGEACPVAQALESAKEIGLDREIRKLPAGYDTSLGASVFERLPPETLKLITIARTLNRADDMVILDEPTAHLSPTGRKELVNALIARRGRTTVLIASSDEEFLAAADFHLQVEGDGARLQRGVAREEQII